MSAVGGWVLCLVVLTLAAFGCWLFVVGCGAVMLLFPSKPVTATRIMPDVTVEGDIAEITVVVGHEECPPGFTMLTRTQHHKTGNLNEVGLPEAKVHLAVRRSFTEPPISDVGVILNPGELERVPDGWELVEFTKAGQPANLNHLTQGPPVFLCVKHLAADAPPTTPRLHNIDVLWGNQKPVTGFKKVAKTLGAVRSVANLNTGTSFDRALLAVEYGSRRYAPHPSCFLNGTYETTSHGMMQLWGVAPTATITMLGQLDRDRQRFQLAVVPVAHTQPGSTSTSYRGYGFLYDNPRTVYSLKPGYAVEFTLDDKWRTMKGKLYGPKPSDKMAWDLFHDDSVRIAFKRDFGTIWQNGREVSTDRVADFHLRGLVRNLSTPHIMGGSNEVQCSNCNMKCENERRIVMSRPGNHLMVTITRMKYDSKTAKTVKFLDTVPLMPCIDLPEVAEPLRQVVYPNMSPADVGPIAGRDGRRYGLCVGVAVAKPRALGMLVGLVLPAV